MNHVHDRQVMTFNYGTGPRRNDVTVVLYPCLICGDLVRTDTSDDSVLSEGVTP